MRLIGNHIQHLALENNISISELSDILQCEEKQIKLFFKGRAIVSYQQLQKLSEFFSVSIQELLQDSGNIDKDKEFILDIIDDYMDIKDSL